MTSRVPSQVPRPLSAAHVEQLADTRLLLDTAVHNLAIAVRSKLPDQGLANAVEQVAQAHAALQRIAGQLGDRLPSSDDKEPSARDKQPSAGDNEPSAGNH